MRLELLTCALTNMVLVASEWRICLLKSSSVTPIFQFNHVFSSLPRLPDRLLQCGACQGPELCQEYSIKGDDTIGTARLSGDYGSWKVTWFCAGGCHRLFVSRIWQQKGLRFKFNTGGRIMSLCSLLL